MKNKAIRGFCLLICLVMLLSTFAACNRKDGNITTAEPVSDDWVQGLPGYIQIELTDAEIKALVIEALGDEAKDFNGDLSTLTVAQLKKVQFAAEVAGYAYEKGIDGRIVIKKTVPLSDAGGGSVALSAVELEQLVEEVLGEEIPENFDGNLGSLSPEQLSKVEQAATDKGYVIDNSGSSPTINKVVDTEPEKLTTAVVIEESEIKKAIRRAVGTFKMTSFDGNYKELDAATQKKLVDELLAIKVSNAQIKEYWKDNYPGQEAPVLPSVAVTTTQSSQGGVKPTTSTTKPNPTDGFKTTGTRYERTTTINTVTHQTIPTLTSEPISTSAQAAYAVCEKVSTYNATQFNAVALCNDNTPVAVATSAIGAAEKGYHVSYGVIVKYNDNGEVAWTDNYGGDGLTAFSDVAVLSNGDIIVAGYTMAKNLGDQLYKGKGTSEGIVLKYNSKGERKWVKMVGGEASDMLYCVAATIDGGYVVGGKSFSRTLDLSEATNTITSFVFKYDANGNRVWNKMMGGTKHSAVTSLDVSPSGDVFACYSTADATGDFAAISGLKVGRLATVVVKYSSGGGFKWLVPIYETGSIEMKGIAYSSNGGCVVAGQYAATKEGTKYSLAGNYNGGDIGTTDGCFFKIREITYENGTTSGQIYWAKTFVGFQSEHLTGIAKVEGGYIISGYSNSSNRDLTPVGNLGDYDSFAYFVNEHGSYQTMAGFSGSGVDQARGICSNGKNMAYVCGVTTSNDEFYSSCSPTNSEGIAYITKINVTLT